MRYRLAYPPTRSVGWPAPPPAASELRHGELLKLAPTIVWNGPLWLRLVGEDGFDTTLGVVEPVDNPFAANQQSVQQVLEMVRRGTARAWGWGSPWCTALSANTTAPSRCKASRQREVPSKWCCPRSP